MVDYELLIRFIVESKEVQSRRELLVFILPGERMEKLRAQELCESRDGRPCPPVRNSQYGLCGCKATWELALKRAEAIIEGDGGAGLRQAELCLTCG